MLISAVDGTRWLQQRSGGAGRSHQNGARVTPRDAMRFVMSGGSASGSSSGARYDRRGADARLMRGLLGLRRPNPAPSSGPVVLAIIVLTATCDPGARVVKLDPSLR